jgi:hypothetical protein
VHYRPSQADPKPVRHWLLDRDMLIVMKMLYGWKGKTTVKDLMEDSEILINFFGSEEEGQRFLSLYSEEQWQDLPV